MAKITRDATIHTGTDAGTSTNPRSITKTIPADCTMVVICTVCKRSGVGQDLASVTVNSVNCTKITASTDTSTSVPRIEAWYLVNPSTGSQTITFTYGGTSTQRAYIVLYFKDQHATTPVNAVTPLVASGSSTAPAIGPISSNTNGTVYSVIAWNSDAITIDGSPIGQVDSNASGSSSREMAVYEDVTSGSSTQAQTLSSAAQWRAVQFVLDGVAGGGGSSIAAIVSGYQQRGLM